MKTTRAHITKEELLQAREGDTFLLIDGIRGGMQFDGNAFVNEMKSTTPLTISDMEYAKSHGVVVKEHRMYKYTYDMIKAIYRDGNLLFSYDRTPLLPLTHEKYISLLQENGITLTDKELKISSEYILESEWNDLKIGDTVNLRLDLVKGREYGECTFTKRMNQYDKEKCKMLKLTVGSVEMDNGYITIKELDGYRFSRQMIESVIKNKKN